MRGFDKEKLTDLNAFQRDLRHFRMMISIFVSPMSLLINKASSRKTRPHNALRTIPCKREFYTFDHTRTFTSL